MLTMSHPALQVPLFLLALFVQVTRMFSDTSSTAGTFQLPPLPYEYTALEPHIGKTTLEIHHDKHHAKYVNTLNSMIASESSSSYQGSTLIDIIKKSYRNNDHQGIFNNAAQSWNHEFYWKCMTADYQEPDNKSLLMSAIEKDFGSFEAFKAEFAEAGNTAFGSGWAWLSYDASSSSKEGGGGKLVVTNTIGADNPMAIDENLAPILTMDVWEHAYYLDYQNLRPAYVQVFLDKLVNWAFVADNYVQAVKASADKNGEL
jgi:Fe-Mn family superoxide dismutase